MSEEQLDAHFADLFEGLAWNEGDIVRPDQASIWPYDGVAEGTSAAGHWRVGVMRPDSNT